MKINILNLLLPVILTMYACSLAGETPIASPFPSSTHTLTIISSTETGTSMPTQTVTPIPTLTATLLPLPTQTITPTPRPVVERLKAQVTAGRLSCRYGPGPEYLYLFAFRQGASIELVGRVDAGNWDWVWVENQTRCWVHVPISPGDFEDDTMQTYIVEVWRCVGGELIFDPLATSLAFITFIDEPGCSEPSHGQILVQEKHGYAGPAEIPWPEY